MDARNLSRFTVLMGDITDCWKTEEYQIDTKLPMYDKILTYNEVKELGKGLTMRSSSYKENLEKWNDRLKKVVGV